MKPEVFFQLPGLFENFQVLEEMVLKVAERLKSLYIFFCSPYYPCFSRLMRQAAQLIHYAPFNAFSVKNYVTFVGSHVKQGW